MEKWKCEICGYVYDPVKGDPERDIPSGTRFEDFSDDWACPICGIDKEMFNKIAAK